MFGVTTVVNTEEDFWSSHLWKSPNFGPDVFLMGPLIGSVVLRGWERTDSFIPSCITIKQRFNYMIGYLMPGSGLPERFEQLHIPPQTYAIFSTGLFLDGQSGIHELWRRIWGEWFPSSNYEFANGPEFEMTYDRGNRLYEIEVWIPVVKKPGA